MLRAGQRPASGLLFAARSVGRAASSEAVLVLLAVRGPGALPLADDAEPEAAQGVLRAVLIGEALPLSELAAVELTAKPLWALVVHIADPALSTAPAEDAAL